MNPPRTVRSRSEPARTVPASAVAVVAALLTLLGSWIPSYWNDEAATLRLARLPIADLLAFVHEKDAVHAVYGLLMHGWIAVAGESELAVRAPSALAAGAATAGVLVLLRDLDRPRAAMLAAIVFVLLPRTSFNGTEARSYALTTALVVWAAVLVLRAARDGGVLRWLSFAAVAGAANAVFLYSVLVLPALVVLAATIAEQRWAAAARSALAGLLSVLLASPIILLAAGQGSQIGWLASQAVNAWTVAVEPFFGSAVGAAVLVAGAIGVAAVRSWRRPARTPSMTPAPSRPVSIPSARILSARILPGLVLWLFGPVTVLLLGTAIVGPMYTPRYLSMSSPALAIVLGLVLASWRPVVSALLVGLLVIAVLPDLAGMRSTTGKPGGQDLRGIAGFLRENARPGDAFLLGDTGTVSLRPRIALAAYPAAFAGLVDVALERPYTTTGTYSDVLLDDARLAAALDGEDRVWVVSSTAASAADAVDDLDDRGLVRGAETELPTVVITLWERPAGG